MYDGLALINKPSGITSFQALAALKKRLGTGRVGHAGTLDRFADGLLVALSGKYTRLVRLFMNERKEYRAVVCFGTGTATFDPEGAVTGSGPIPERESLEKVLSGFCGKLMQKPPAFSAVHVAGRRAYQCARKGLSVTLQARPVMIYALELAAYAPPRATMRVLCSKGTYIRALARDIAEALRTCAFVESLSRLAVGDFRLSEAVDPQNFDPARDLIQPRHFIPRLSSLGRVTVRREAETEMRTGKAIRPGFFESAPAAGENAVFSNEGELVAIINRENDRFSYSMVMQQEAD